MPFLVAAGVGALASIVFALVVAKIAKRPTTARELVAAGIGGAVAGVAFVATLGTGAVGVALGREVAAFAVSGAAGGASEQVTSNALDGRPLGQSVGLASAEGAALGVVFAGAGRSVRGVSSALVRRGPEAVEASAKPSAPTHADSATEPPASIPEAAPEEIGIVGALEGERAPLPEPRPQAQPRAPPAFASIHAAPPAWLESRFQETVEAVRAGRSGPKADPEDVASFLHETYEHVEEVNALTAELGGRPRPIPTAEPPSGETLRGVHDFGERASVRRVEALVEELRKNPIKDRDGVPLELPAWLANLPAEARAAGDKTIDVSKLSPHVAAGLAKKGLPDPFAIRLHNLAPHHAAQPSGSALVEAVADKVNAMRQVRIYRAVPMAFDKIREILLSDLERGALPEEARPLIDRAVAAEAALERSGAVNPYHTVPPR